MLKGKTALITGSSLGIGYAAAEKLAAQGCNIVLNGIEDAAEIDPKAQALVHTHGIRAIYEPCNVGVGDALETLISRSRESFGSIDIVINNAVSRVFGAIENIAPADWECSITVNLTSAYRTIHHTLPEMKQKGWGRIINMSSIYGLIGTADRSSYVTTKTALIGLTRAVAYEVAKYPGITCNAVCPGTVKTTHADNTIRRTMETQGISETEAAERFLHGKQPSGRFVEAESVAEMVAFLCGNSGRDINGAVLPIDHAWSAS